MRLLVYSQSSGERKEEQRRTTAQLLPRCSQNLLEPATLHNVGALGYIAAPDPSANCSSFLGHVARYAQLSCANLESFHNFSLSTTTRFGYF